MSQLVLLLLLAFFFVIALALTLWAALTLGSPRKGRAVRTEAQPAPAPTGPKRPWERSSEPEVAPTGVLWRNDKSASAAPRPLEPTPRQGDEAERAPRVTVTPRAASEDAFERFLKSEERSGRG